MNGERSLDETPRSGEVLLKTGRLVLRKPEDSDLPAYLRLFSDGEAMRFLGEPWSPEETGETLREWMDGWKAGKFWYATIETIDGGNVAGMAGLSADTVEGEEGLELTWFILGEHQGMGYATEATRALLDLAFGSLGAERVLAETHPSNRGAIRVLEKTGFSKVGDRSVTYDFLPAFSSQSLWEIRR